MKLIVTINHRFSQTLSAAAFAFSFMLGFSAENAARADDVTNFYVGKQITMLVGFGVVTAVVCGRVGRAIDPVDDGTSRAHPCLGPLWSNWRLGSKRLTT